MECFVDLHSWPWTPHISERIHWQLKDVGLISESMTLNSILDILQFYVVRSKIFTVAFFLFIFTRSVSLPQEDFVLKFTLVLSSPAFSLRGCSRVSTALSNCVSNQCCLTTPYSGCERLFESRTSKVTLSWQKAVNAVFLGCAYAHSLTRYTVYFTFKCSILQVFPHIVKGWIVKLNKNFFFGWIICTFVFKSKHLFWEIRKGDIFLWCDSLTITGTHKFNIYNALQLIYHKRL